MRDLLALLLPPDLPAGADAAPLAQAQALLAAARPDVLVLLDAAWRPKGFAVGTGDQVADTGGTYRAQGERSLAHALIDTAISYGLPSFAEEVPLTAHAAAMLERLWPARDLPVLPLGVATASPSLLQEFGHAIAASARDAGRRAVTLCLGAIAHDHQAEHDGRQNPATERFGGLVLEHLARSGGEELFDIEGGLWLQAHPEADLCHLALLLGVTGVDAECEVLGRWRSPGIFSAAVAFYRAQALRLGAALPWEAAHLSHPL